MLKKSLLFSVISFATIFAAFPLEDPYHGYYNDAVGKKGSELKTALYNIIKNNTFIEYNDLWKFFPRVYDKGDGVVFDIYSNVPDSVSPYEFTFETGQCGQYKTEGDCFNREHSVPNSWFGGSATKWEPIYSDLFHLYPTDGYVNSKRNNMPYGEVEVPKWTSQNGSKIGKNTYSADYTGTVFEPLDAFKGDLARTYFYMSLRYQEKYFTYDTVSIFEKKSELKPWALAMFTEWSALDSVDNMESAKNDSVQKIQNNRNPFIDFPELVQYLWGDSVNVPWEPYIVTQVADYQSIKSYSVYPNPADNAAFVSNPDYRIQRVSVLNELGQLVLTIEHPADASVRINTADLKSGVYFVKIEDLTHTETSKLIIR